jgi:hypothetical protein
LLAVSCRAAALNLDAKTPGRRHERQKKFFVRDSLVLLRLAKERLGFAGSSAQRTLARHPQTQKPLLAILGALGVFWRFFQRESFAERLQIFSSRWQVVRDSAKITLDGNRFRQRVRDVNSPLLFAGGQTRTENQNCVSLVTRRTG